MRLSSGFLACALLFASVASGQSKLPSITGRITELAGNPLEGATVKISTAAGEPIWHGVTDSTGEFGTDKLRQGTYLFEVLLEAFIKSDGPLFLGTLMRCGWTSASFLAN